VHAAEFRWVNRPTAAISAGYAGRGDVGAHPSPMPVAGDGALRRHGWRAFGLELPERGRYRPVSGGVDFISAASVLGGETIEGLGNHRSIDPFACNPSRSRAEEVVERIETIICNSRM
jgi:hypothetical protein